MPKSTAIAVCNLDARQNDIVMVVVQDKYSPTLYHVKPRWAVAPERIVYTSGDEYVS